jgi:WD40 repeat protein/tetratricopeptide (TPR) repeat protein
LLPGGTAVSMVESSGRRQPFFRSVAQLGRQAAQGLAYAHSRGVVHRDIKPSNLLLDTAGVVWITDFGLAKAQEDGLTATGDILGTIRYMAPERFRGQGDARADIYALGLTLYELLTLRPAFDTPDRLKLIERVKNEEPVRPRSLDGRIPRDLETIVLKATDKDPAQRYATAESMSEDLRRFLNDEPIQARQASTAERYWRWARRNPVIAVMGGVLTALLIAITLASLAAASYFKDSARRESNLAGRERLANEQSQRDRKDAIEARREAIEERDRSRQQSSSLALDKGLALGEEGRADHGLLWMLEALETAPADASGFRTAVRWNLGAWLGQVHKPLRIGASIGHCTHLGFSPDGSKYATAFDAIDRERATPVVLWDTATGAKLKTLDGALAPFAFRSDGKVLFACAEPRGALAVELATERVLWKSTQLPGVLPRGIDLSADGSTVFAHRANLSRQHWLIRLDAATGQQLGELLELPDLVAVDPNGRAAVVIHGEKGEPRIAIIEVPSRRLIVSWPVGGARSHLSGRGWSRFSPDGTTLYNTVVRGGVLLNQSESEVSRIWDTLHGQAQSPMMVASDFVTYTPAADRFLTLTNHVWLLRRAPDGQPLGSGFSWVDARCQNTHPDGLTVVTLTQDHTLCLGQISSEAEPIAGERLGHQSTTLDLPVEQETAEASLLQNGFLTDGRIAITNARGVFERERTRVTDLASGRPLGKPSLHQAGWVIRGLALSPDGQLFATGSNPDGRTAGEVRLWEARTGRLRFPPLLHSNYVVALAFHPGGKVLAAGDYSGLVRLWDTSTGREIGRPLPQGEIVLSLAYSPDGKTLAVGLANDHTGKPGIRLWDTETREQIGGLLLSAEPVQRIELRPDGRALLAVHVHHTQLWDTVVGRQIGGPMLDESPGGFRSDGRAFLTIGKDGVVKLRDAMMGVISARLLTASSRATCAAFRADGRLVAAGFQDGSVRLCDATNSVPIGPPRFLEHALDKVTFTPDGESVAGIDIAGNSRVWRVPRPLPDENLDKLRLRIEARTGLRMENANSIARLDTVAWRDRLEQLGQVDPSALRLEVGPDWHEPMVREAEQTGNAFAAIWHLDRLIAARPDDWSLYARRGGAWSLSDRLDRAAVDYQEAERLGKREDVLDFQVHCVFDCTKAGRWTEALWYLDRLIAARPDERLLHEDRAAVYGKLGREADRQAELARVFELEADEGLVIPRAEELGRAGRWIEAARLLARCGRKGPLSPELAQAWGVACLKAGDRAGYHEACMADMAVQGSDPTVVWNALSAASLFALGPDGPDDYRVPTGWCEERLSAVHARPTLHRRLFSSALGGLLLRAGRTDEAIVRLYEGIAAANEGDTPIDWGYLAVAHARKGDFAEARLSLELVRASRPDPRASFWDLQELAILRSEAESLLFDAEFPKDPFQRSGTS